MSKQTEEEKLLEEAIKEMERLEKALQAQLDKLAEKEAQKKR